MWSFWVEGNLCRFFIVCLLQMQLSRGEVWDPINCFKLCHTFVPVPSQDLDFRHHRLWSFLCVHWAAVRGDCFVLIVDHQCLSFLFILMGIKLSLFNQVSDTGSPRDSSSWFFYKVENNISYLLFLCIFCIKHCHFCFFYKQ